MSPSAVEAKRPRNILCRTIQEVDAAGDDVALRTLEAALLAVLLALLAVLLAALTAFLGAGVET